MTSRPENQRIAPWIAESLQTLAPSPQVAGAQALALRLAVDLDEAERPADVAALSARLHSLLVDLQLVPSRPASGPADGEEVPSGPSVLDGLRGRVASRIDRASPVDPSAP